MPLIHDLFSCFASLKIFFFWRLWFISLSRPKGDVEKEKFPFSPLPYSADAAALGILSVQRKPRKVFPIDSIVKDNSPLCVFFICEETHHLSLPGFMQYWTYKDGNNRENTFLLFLVFE